MASRATLVLLTVGLVTGSAHAVEAWQAKPHWQPDPGEGQTVTDRGGALDFCVPEPGCGMEWPAALEEPAEGGPT